jgi:large subunit ribosomal protein L21
MGGFAVDITAEKCYICNPFKLNLLAREDRTMFAVVEIAGKQYRVAPNDTIAIPTMKGKTGEKVKFDKVLLVGAEKEIRVGNPLVAGAKVEATVLGPVRAEKVIVFKKKRRKGYRRTRGHRQGYTQVQITSIG